MYIECLSRIASYLFFLQKNKDIRIHVYTITTNIKYMLNMLGIEPHRIIDGNIRAPIVYMPAGSGCGHPPLFATQLLSIDFDQK